MKQLAVGTERMNLPVEVEGESFAPGSASGKKFETHYLTLLGLERTEAAATDLLPYYLANTTGTGGRSMADNIASFERATRTVAGIEKRPPAPELVAHSPHRTAMMTGS